MTGAIKYGSPTLNQTSFIGTQTAGLEIGYTAWMLQNLDYDSVNDKFTKPRGSLSSRALALGTGEKTLRLMVAPTSETNGDDADLSTVFSVDFNGNIITQNEGTSAQWNTAYNRGDFRDHGLGTDCKISTNWDNITQSGFYRNGDSSTVGIPLAVGSIAMLHMEVNGNAVQMAFRSGGSNYYIRRRTTSTWSSWDSVLTSSNISTSDISNWNAAFGWGDHVGKYVGFAGNTGYATLFTGNINELPVGNIVHAISGSATNQPTDIGTPRSLFTFGARSGSDTPLASDLVIGISGMSFRNRTNDIWRRVWTDSDFTQSNIDNWNTAYNRGDYKDFGLGINTTLIYPETDLNSVTVSNGFYTVPNTILNIPTNAGGALTVERYSTYITQKYQAVNAGDVVRMFIRHYKTDSASWTPWRQIWTDENFSPDDKAEVNDTLSFKGIIPSNDDINNYTVNGFYSTESSTTANLPVEDKGILTVTSNGNDHSQTYTNYNSNEFYFRTSSPSGGGWNSWERVAKSSERVINNTLTSPPTAASLNSLYPSVNATFTVIAPNVEKGNMYVKTDNGWLVFTGNTVF